jgi:hypothetical protein
VTAREKWFRFLAGEDVGPMVSPLCDNWSLDVPYRWPYDEPEPFPPGDPQHALSQQMAMAAVCGWDPTFVTWVPLEPREPEARVQSEVSERDGRRHIEQRVRTPTGDLVQITEQAAAQHVIKPWIESEEDYRRALWVTRQQMDCDEALTIREGRRLRDAVGEKGVLGTWVEAPSVNFCNREAMFYHQADWPETFDELHHATRKLLHHQAGILRKAGFDYLFYVVDGTEWINPQFYVTRYRDFTRDLLAKWRALGGFVLWHSCGRIRRFVEEGFYNEALPEIFETMSEQPIGDLPSLRWGRERLDPRIATKGNIPLDVLLRGTPDDVRREVRRVKEETRGFRHIVGLSDDILPNTPLANAEALVEESRA